MEAIKVLAALCRAEKSAVRRCKSGHLAQRVVFEALAIAGPNVCLDALDFTLRSCFVGKYKNFPHERRRARILRLHFARVL
jgi:hypothetical protein